MLRVLRLIIFAAGLGALPAKADLRLLMIEQPGCVYCDHWNAEIAPIYPRSPEGKAAPLERVQFGGPYPADAEIDGRPVFTPTFILIADGREAGRIDGYPGEDFFWGLLGQMMRATGQFHGEDPQ